MKFEYTGRHLEVTPAIREHVEEHFQRIDHLFDKEDHHAHTIIEVERGKHHSEMVVKWHNQVLTANSVSEDMYQSLTQTIGKIEKQALKLKSKIIDKSHKATKISQIVQPSENENVDGDGPHIISVENYAIKPMSADEAVLELDEDENQFLVFRNSVDERVSVVYKRKDGNYGLIQP